MSFRKLSFFFNLFLHFLSVLKKKETSQTGSPAFTLDVSCHSLTQSKLFIEAARLPPRVRFKQKNLSKKCDAPFRNPLFKVNSSNRDKVVPPGGTSITDHGQFPSIPATERRRGSWPSCWGARKALEPVWRRRRRSWSGYRTERHRGKAHYDDLFRSGQHAYSDAEGRRQGLQQG